jgi:hypothetical protein
VVELDTTGVTANGSAGIFSGGETLPLQGRSLVLLREREVSL